MSGLVCSHIIYRSLGSCGTYRKTKTESSCSIRSVKIVAMRHHARRFHEADPSISDFRGPPAPTRNWAGLLLTPERGFMICTAKTFVKLHQHFHVFYYCVFLPSHQVEFFVCVNVCSHVLWSCFCESWSWCHYHWITGDYLFSHQIQMLLQQTKKPKHGSPVTWKPWLQNPERWVHCTFKDLWYQSVFCHKNLMFRLIHSAALRWNLHSSMLEVTHGAPSCSTCDVTAPNWPFVCSYTWWTWWDRGEGWGRCERVFYNFWNPNNRFEICDLRDLWPHHPVFFI